MSRRPRTLHSRRPLTALITGASSGIGEATARLLHARGWQVALVARSAEPLRRLAEELGEAAYARPCDVSDIAQLPALVDDVVARFGGIDALVNNAGVHHRGSMLRHTPERLAEMITVNTVAPIALTRIAADVMPAGSVVVNVASLAGKLPVPGAATYSGSKAGVRFWALAAQEDLAGRGIRIACVNPGPVDSGFLETDWDNVTPMTLSQPMSTVEQCARAVLRAIETDTNEIDLPGFSGRLATLGYVSPRLRGLLRPVLERRGRQVKQRLRPDSA